MKNKLIILLFILYNFCHFSIAQTLTKSQILQKKLNSFLKQEGLQNASFSACVFDVKSKKVIASKNQNLSLVPASTTKLISTATALEILGKDFQFETKIQYDGTINEQGILNGNIYIKGGGDPALGSERFEDFYQNFLENWRDTLLKLGIKKINGAIVGDATIFDSQSIPDTWLWGDMGNYYGAGPSGLSVYDNTYFIYLKSENKNNGWTKIVEIEPKIPNLNFKNELKASDINKDLAYIYGAPLDFERTLRGTIPKNRSRFKIKGSIPDPALLIAQQLQKTLEDTGIVIMKKATTMQLSNPEIKTRKTIFITSSPTLSEIIKLTNTKSVNLYAEHLVKYIGWHENKNPSTKESTDFIQDFWQEKGINTTGFYLNDGSGLSRHNVLTSKQLAELLVYMKTEGKYFESFENSLAIAGKTGTLKSLCKGTYAANNLKGKSGYMSRVRSYAGYVKTKSGKELAFALVLNNYTCTAYQAKKKLEKLMVQISEL